MATYRRNTALIALAVLVVVVAAWVVRNGRAQNKQESAPEDLVEVLVAAKNLPVGTYFDRDNLSTMVTRKKVPRLSLPAAYVIDEAILLDKRLVRDLAAGKMLTPAMVAKGVLMPLRDEDDLSTLAYRTHDANGRLITPGRKYDVIATVGTPNGEEQTYTLLVNMLVLAVDAIPNLDENRPQPGKASVSLRATQRQAVIIALAKIKGCRIELSRSSSGKPNTEQDENTVLKLIEGLPEQAARSDNTAVDPPALPDAPAPLPKGLAIPKGTRAVSIHGISPNSVRFLAPNSKVDIITTIREGRKLKAITVLTNVLVVLVEVKYPNGDSRNATTTVAFALDMEQAKVLALAQNRGCTFELMLRQPGKSDYADFDLKAVLATLKELPYQGVPPVAPFPRAKGDDR